PATITSHLSQALQGMVIYPAGAVSRRVIRRRGSQPMPDHSPLTTHPSSIMDPTLSRHSFQIEGPFETSYSLAVVNREVAFALEKLNPGKVGLFATEGPRDDQPDMKQVRRIPGLESLCVRGRKD